MGRRYWKQGEQSEIAGMCGVKVQYINDILHRRRKVSPDFAMKLEEAAQILGKDIPWTEWILNFYTSHSGFFGDPLAKN